jgi:1,2-diacylglycerol 3-beta-galactosyltransferase
VRVELFDPLVGHGPPFVRRLTSLYPTIIQRARPAWGAIYHASNTRPSFATLRTALGAGVRRVIAERIRTLDPDLLISVHPLLNHITARAIRDSGRPRPLVTVVTDLIDLHRGWACPSASLIAVPTEQARVAVLRHHVRRERVRLLGFPVDLRFRPPAPGEREALRRSLGLDEHRHTLLVTAGGEGSGGLLRQVRALAWDPHPWQVIAVCGRNEHLRSRLARLRFGTPTLVLGFVESMPDLMRASDMVVGKAGPGAIAEALATELPLVVTSYLPGQETANVRFVAESGFGVYAPRPDELLGTVQRLMGSDGHELGEMAARAASVARPYASLDIARECLQLYQAASHANR